MPQNSTDSEASWGTKKRDWVTFVRVLKTLGVLAGGTLIGLTAYAAKTYIREIAMEQVAETYAAVAPLNAKVQSLEEFRAREENVSRDMQLQMSSVFIKLSALETMQTNTKENTERILRKLDRP